MATVGSGMEENTEGEKETNADAMDGRWAAAADAAFNVYMQSNWVPVVNKREDRKELQQECIHS